MIKRTACTKRPLLADECPVVRLTLDRRTALMSPGLIRAWAGAGEDLSRRRDVPPIVGADPTPATGPRPGDRRGTASAENALNVRGGLMGNSATVGAGQEQHLRALEYANRV